MRYVMKQKLFCWGDDFTIKKQAGQDVFFVDGKAFSVAWTWPVGKMLCWCWQAWWSLT